MNKLALTAIALVLGCGAAQAANPEAGKEKSRTCAACHGADGNKTIDAQYPRIAGQYADYLVKAMNDYKSGKRKNPIMGPQAAPLSQRDIQDLSAYYSHQQGLVTRKNSYLVERHK